MGLNLARQNLRCREIRRVVGNSGLKQLRSFAVEITLYSLLVTVYVLVVLNFLSAWLKHLYDNGKTRYALVSLLLIVGQGVVLEALTSLLLRLVRGKTE